MSLASTFVCTAIIDGSPAISKTDLIDRLLTLLAQAGHVAHADVPAVRDAILRRERLGSTGIGKGLAIPHAKHQDMQRPLGILAVCRPPVEYDSLDGEPVDVIALILSPPDRPGRHLGEASRGSEGLVRRLADESFCLRLRQGESAEEVMEVVQAEGGMTRREWMNCKDPAAMLRLLRECGLIDSRKARLFGAACCRRHWDLLPGEGREAVEAAERFADGLAGREDLDAARMAFMDTLGGMSGPASFAGIAVSHLMADARHDPLRYAMDVLTWAAQASENQAEEIAAQAGILRCLFGVPPFRAVEVKPEWLASSDGVVAKLARGIHDERAFTRESLGVLADALLDAGCDEGELMGHLRGFGPHWLGCHVIDLVFGKE